MDANHELVLHVASYHRNREAGYNEENYGIGIRANGIAAGVYRNSIRKTSVYAGFAAQLFEYQGLSFTVLGGLVTGYEHKVSAMLVPEVGWRRNGYGVLMNYVPETSLTSEVVTISFVKEMR